MKKIFKTVLIACFLFTVSPAMANVPDYFNSFYSNYLELRKVNECDREILNLIHNISNDKVKALEKYLNSACSKEEISSAINLIDEEYQDFSENIDFELKYVNNCPLKKKQVKKIKKRHKKFINELKKNYL